MRALEMKYPVAGVAASDTLAARMRAARDHARLSVDDVVAKVQGLSAKRLQALETGTGAQAPDIGLVQKLAALYAVPALWLSAGALAGAKFAPAWYAAQAGAA